MTAFTPNSGQAIAMREFTQMLANENAPMMILAGSAGTGKTSTLQAMIGIAKSEGFETQCLAPTNMAANNITKRIGESSKTIHSYIYDVEQVEDKIVCKPKDYISRKKGVYIVDESSMVSSLKSTGEFVTPGPLLEDLIKHCRKESETCKILFVGDPNQLPPIHGEAMAFSPEFLSNIWQDSCSIGSSKLTEVMRQQQDSPILRCATFCLRGIEQGLRYEVPQNMAGISAGQVIAKISPEIENLTPCLSSVVLASTHKEVSHMNDAIRKHLNRPVSHLVPGDHFFSVRNMFINENLVPQGTYFVVTASDASPESWGGCRFQDVQVAFDLAGESQNVTIKINLDHVFAERPGLGSEQEKQLKHEAMKTNLRYRETERESDDPHLSACRVRLSYAMTVHKAQGQEFDHVYVIPAWLSMWTDSFKYRHLYTGVTRARKSVHRFRLYLP